MMRKILSAAAIFTQLFLSAGLSAQDKTVELPLKNVVLFSSGVGAFVHEGVAEGKTVICFSVRESQLNDMLKSLFVTASGPVMIESIGYPSKLPLTELLRDYRVNMQNVSALSDVLHQMKGAEFSCSLDGDRFDGRLAGVETVPESIGPDTVRPVEYLSFITSTGLRRVKLDNLSLLQPKDPALLAELNKALEILSGYRDTSARELTLRLNSEGKNPVRAAYVIESPVWKASYRLNLPSGKDGEPFLQAWALVENPTKNEWKDVTLSLVSGQPSSFVQDLYSSIYLSRPVMQRQSYAGFQPVRHDAGMETFAACDAAEPVMEEAKHVLAKSMNAAGTARKAQSYAPAASGAGSAKASAVGELCRYDIARPVTLAGRESAMLELFSGTVEAEKVSIYNRSVNRDRPLSGVLLKNTSGLLLPQGPVTVFAEETYGGDASLPDLPGNEHILLSYGLDLETHADPNPGTNSRTEMVSAKAVNGMLQVNRRTLINSKYTFANKSKKDKVLILEHQKTGEIISSNAPYETTSSGLARFRIELPAEKTLSFPITEERENIIQYRISSLLTNTELMQEIRNGSPDPELKAFFGELAELQARISEKKQALADLEDSIAKTTEAHERTRKTLESVSSGDYRNKLTAQIAELDKKIFDLSAGRESAIKQIRELEKQRNDRIAAGPENGKAK